MYEFTYHAPTSVADAIALLGDGDAKLLAGGHTLLPTMKARLAAPSALVDLRRIEGLRGITLKGDEITIGAMTRHGEVADSSEVNRALPCLAAMAKIIGDPAVRSRGTMGGSVANNDPAADYPAALVALKATVHTDRRTIPADDFFKGLFETALADGEILTAVTFKTGIPGAYEKFRNPASRYALVGVFVAKNPDGVRVAVTGAGASGVFRVPDMERALDADFSPGAIAGIKVPAAGLNSDLHADAVYRAHLIGVMARRAVAAIAAGETGGDQSA